EQAIGHFVIFAITGGNACADLLEHGAHFARVAAFQHGQHLLRRHPTVVVRGSGHAYPPDQARQIGALAVRAGWGGFVIRPIGSIRQGDLPPTGVAAVIITWHGISPLNISTLYLYDTGRLAAVQM